MIEAPSPRSVGQAIADERIDAVTLGAETAQLDALPIDDFFGVAVAPLNGHLARGVGVDEHVECAVAAAQLGQEGDRRCNLPEEGGNLSLDLSLGLFFTPWGLLFGGGRVVLLVVSGGC